jgi:tRNA A-37 threonylcarbamoyl transferase component Bud32
MTVPTQIIRAPVGSSTDSFEWSAAPDEPALGPPAVPGELGTFGGYRLVEKIGAGGMGVVYRAVDPTLGRLVALKVLRPRIAASARGWKRFLREGRAVAAIRHDHVVTIFHVSETDQAPFIVMEHLSGGSLEARFKGPPMTVAELVRVGREVAEGLAAAHAVGIVHRDVKPANVWLDVPARPDAGPPAVPFRTKVLDFGLAHFDSSDAPLTRDGAVVGSLPYMAPEQANGCVDHRSDLYSLGVVLYQGLIGQLPFEGVNALTRLSNPSIVIDQPPVAQLAPDVPPALAGLIDRLICPDPQGRPTSAAEVARELRALEAGLLVGTVRPAAAPDQFDSWETVLEEPSAETARPARRGRVLIWAAGASVVLAAACAAAAAAYLAGRGPVAHAAAPPRADAGAVPGAVPGPPPPVRRPDPPPAQLLPGKDLLGWHPPRGGRIDGWSVADGSVTGTPKPGGSQWLLTDKEYDDVDLRVEYRWLKPKGHTSVMIRAHESGKPAEPVLGLQVNIREEAGADDNWLYRTGGIFMIKGGEAPVVKPTREWNELRVVARGQRVVVEHNGKRTLDVNLDLYPNRVGAVPALKWPKGAIGLCSHVWAPIEFRSVTLAAPPKEPQ